MVLKDHNTFHNTINISCGKIPIRKILVGNLLYALQFQFNEIFLVSHPKLLCGLLVCYWTVTPFGQNSSAQQNAGVPVVQASFLPENFYLARKGNDLWSCDAQTINYYTTPTSVPGFILWLVAHATASRTKQLNKLPSEASESLLFKKRHDRSRGEV